MERVGVLINKLQEQLAQQADIHNMLVTAQLLQGELLLQCKQTNGNESKKIAVIMPHSIPADYLLKANENLPVTDFYKPVIKPDPDPQPIGEPDIAPQIIPDTEPLPTPKPEPEPIPHFVEEKPWQRLFADKDDEKPHWTLDPVMDIPTLAHQEKIVFELNDVMIAENGSSVNDVLKQDNAEVATKLQDTPVKDLKKAISINDRHRFIQELFRGDETMYERSVKTLNGFNIFAEAEYWIQRELKVKLGWDTTLELVKVFDQVVKRRFS